MEKYSQMLMEIIRKSILITFLGFTFFGYSQECNVGNSDISRLNDSTGNFSRGYLLGGKFTLENSGELTAINLIGKNTGAQVQMAVYDDDNGVPNNLIVESETGTVGAGTISLPVVTPVILPAGDYWIMAVYSSTGLHTYKGGNTIIYYYDAVTLGDDIPTNASDFDVIANGKEFAYFLSINCVTTAMEGHFSETGINTYPNPVESELNIEGEFTNWTLTDYKGVFLKEGMNRVIDVANLSPGVYLLKINGEVKRFVKE